MNDFDVVSRDLCKMYMNERKLKKEKNTHKNCAFRNDAEEKKHRLQYLRPLSDSNAISMICFHVTFGVVYLCFISVQFSSFVM